METESKKQYDDKLSRLVTYLFVNDFEKAQIIEQNDPVLADKLYDGLIIENKIPSLDIVEYVLN